MNLVAEMVYLLCALTSIACTLLLARGYRRRPAKLLLWSTLCFGLLAANNFLLFLDLVIFPTIDLTPWRDIAGLLALGVLVFGLIWDLD